MDRDARWVLPIVLLAMGVGCGGADRRPDVLLITVDTLRADYLGSYGFDEATSPWTDALAAEGVLFERAIAASPATAPSHASIMTARYPRQHSVGHSNGGTRLEGVTLAEIFREAGWETAAFVGNLVLERRTGFDRGFDHYDDEFDRRERNRAYYERVAEATTGRALAWLKEHSDAPRFVWVHYQDPHGPYDPPGEDRDRFDLAPWPGDTALEVVPGLDGRGGIPEYQAIEGLTLPREYRARYAGEIHYADRWIGRLVAEFRSDARDPIVLLTADHGESLGEHGRYFVHFFTSTPENAHVPFVLVAPGLAPGRRTETVSHVDVMPTLLELAGLEGPDDMRGLALGPFLRDGRQLPERDVYCDAGHEVSIYRDRYFVRVLDTSEASASETPRRLNGPPRISAFPWPAGPSPAALGRFAEIGPEALAYFASRPQEIRAPDLDAETRARLRALGYAP